MAIAVGASTPEHPHQLALWRLSKARGWSADQTVEASAIAAQARLREAAESRQLDLLSLVGVELPAVSDLDVRIEVRRAIRARLASEEVALSVATNPRRRVLLEATGATIDPDRAGWRRALVLALLRNFDQLATRGGLADLINCLMADAAESGRSAAAVVGEHWQGL